MRLKVLSLLLCILTSFVAVLTMNGQGVDDQGLDDPGYKAYRFALRELLPAKRLAAFEKFVADYPESSFVAAAQLQLLHSVIKIVPADKERIYRQALQTIASVETGDPKGSTDSVSATYGEVVDALVAAKMDDRAEEVAKKQIALIDQLTAETLFRTKHPAWLRLGEIYLRKGDLQKAEAYFEQSISGDYEGNAAFLGLAEIAERRGNDKLQLDYLISADTRGRLNKEQRAALETLYAKKIGGSTDRLIELLDENYKKANPLPFEVVEYMPTAERSKQRGRRVVLAELFAGSNCLPCVTADTTFEALLERYDSNEVAVLTYDVHIPSPDPLANPAGIDRSNFYGVGSSPVYIVDGTTRESSGGKKRKFSKTYFDALTPKIDARLEKESGADLKLLAVVENGSVKTEVAFDDVKGDYANLRLHIGLVENEISYTGANGVRFHPMVVRELGGTDRKGFALKGQRGKIEWRFDLQQVSADLKNYIDRFEQDQQKEDPEFAFAEKKYRLNVKNLSVVAFIQDEKTKGVLQSAFVDLSRTK